MSDAGFEDILSQWPFCVESAVALVDIIAFAKILHRHSNPSCLMQVLRTY